MVLVNSTAIWKMWNTNHQITHHRVNSRWIKDWLIWGWTEFPLSICLLKLQYLKMWLYLETGLLKGIKLRWAPWIKIGSNPIWLVPLQEKEIWTQRNVRNTHLHREKTMWEVTKRLTGYVKVTGLRINQTSHHLDPELPTSKTMKNVISA